MRLLYRWGSGIKHSPNNNNYHIVTVSAGTIAPAVKNALLKECTLRGEDRGQGNFVIRMYASRLGQLQGLLQHFRRKLKADGVAQACIVLGNSEWCQLVLVSMLSRDPDKCYNDLASRGSSSDFY